MSDTIEQAFEETFREMYDEGTFNGVIMIDRGSDIIYEEAFGISDIEEETQLSLNGIFNLASVSKQFTALCIMILKEQGKLNYDDAITDYLIELPYSHITIRHLLHHTSGLAAYEDMIDEHWGGDAETEFITNDDLVRIFARHDLELVFDPGERYEYSNTGYAFLASIVEKVSGKSFERFLQEKVFKPLNMFNAFGHRRPEGPPDTVVQGFTVNDDDEYEDYSYNHYDGIIGDGNVFSSAPDLIRYVRALLAGEIVSKNTLEEAFTSGQTNDGEETGYGFGWEIEGSFVSHTGCWEGYNNFLGIDLESDMIFVVLSNGDCEEVYDGIDEAMGDFYE
jgi:CubicO group peptidase (beta-lactamase class C family)